MHVAMLLPRRVRDHEERRTLEEYNLRGARGISAADGAPAHCSAAHLVRFNDFSESLQLRLQLRHIRDQRVHDRRPRLPMRCTRHGERRPPPPASCGFVARLPVTL